MVSTQWFVRMKSMADGALAAVADGRTKILPVDWTKTYNHFLENIQDWCISRQLWWGHRIPAFHCQACAHITVTRDESVAAKHRDTFPAIELFTIDEIFGGWAKAQREHFDDGGVFDRIYQPGTGTT